MPPKTSRSPAKGGSRPPNTKPSASARSPTKPSDDFVMTLDSDDEGPSEPLEDGPEDGEEEEEEEEEEDAEEKEEDTQAAKHGEVKKPPKHKAQLKSREKIREEVKPSKKNPSPTEAIDINKDFEFDLYGDGSTALSTHHQEWDMSVKGLKNASTSSSVHRLATVDDIIEKRRKARPEIRLPQPESDQDGFEEGEQMSEDDEDEDEEEVGGGDFTNFAEESEDEEENEESFGAGARAKRIAAVRAESSDDEEESERGDDDDEDEEEELDPLGSDDQGGDDGQEGEDSEEDSSDGSDQDSDEETEVEKARKAAYFAAEEPKTKSKKSSSKGEEALSQQVTFSSLSLSRPLLRSLSTLSFHQPTPIQARTIPLALAGKDLVAGAVTGSGKTAAFMIPILERLNWRPKGAEEAKSRVLVLAPTRELAIQCFGVGKALGKFMDIRFCLCVGGLSLKSQEAELKLRPEVIIATPGRLIDHTRNSQSFSLDDIEILVMDEADRMLEDGFADELNEIIRSCPKGRQTMLFSATMTDDVEQLVRLSLRRPVRLFVDPKRSTAKKLIQEFVRVRGATGNSQAEDGPSQAVGASSSSSARKTEESHRPALLLSLCTRTFTSQVIIFVRSKKLAHQLRIVFGLLGLKAGELHGDLSQEQRLEALQSFREGKTDFLIATDLASRGLDIRGVQTVINYDMPGQFEQYLHRVGRTARAGRNGRAVTLVGESDRKMLKMALKKSPPEQVKHRLIPSEVVASMAETLEGLKEEVQQVLQEEKEDKALRQAEMELKKGENMIEHREEILSRPKRTWFQTGQDKEAAKNVSKAEYAAKMESLKRKTDDKKDRFAGMSRKKKRSKMMREEVEAENSQGATDAAIRSAKKALRPKVLGIPEPRNSINKLPSSKKRNKQRSSTNKVGKRSSSSSGFERDLGERRSGGGGGGKKASGGPGGKRRPAKGSQRR
ncbi:DEAD-domain-containing protein [Violaceomyces palustris]|uniref:DEAD-domain-containing protein n=1 Tax=Violaceomyces palustris TaxID=1673888 RepID=A0ACD0NLK3_9BASI|nr:DEAD-domain-containing protein [Violaceomyces palustris]